MKTTYNAKEKRKIAASFRRWAYEFDLGDDIVVSTTSANKKKWNNLRKELFNKAIDMVFGHSLKGKKFLDIACNAGFWSYELARRGASYGLAIDRSPEFIRQAHFVRSCIQKEQELEDIEFKNVNFFDLPLPKHKFDLILAMGIVYHLTDPVGFFKKVHKMSRNCIYIDTTVSTLGSEEPILEISDSKKYVSCSPREFSFVPTEAALMRILEHTGFEKITKIEPPSHWDGNAYVKGSRVAILAYK